MSARCYTVARLLDELDMPRRTFFTLKRQGKLPFLEELQPRLGKHPRYRADLIDRYLENRHRPLMAKASLENLRKKTTAA